MCNAGVSDVSKLIIGSLHCFCRRVLISSRPYKVRRCSKFLFGVDHSFNAVVHVLDEIDLGTTESTEVGDVEDAVVGLGVLTMSATDLDVVLVSDGLELVLGSTKLGELDMHGSAHASSAVSGARCDVTKMLVVGELGLLLDQCRGGRESLEDLTDVRALLHGDDTELILLIDPDEECLGVIVVDTTSLGPLAFEAT